MAKYFPFVKYRVSRCDRCIRKDECEKTELALIMCAIAGFFKTGEEEFWTKEDAEELERARLQRAQDIARRL